MSYYNTSERVNIKQNHPNYILSSSKSNLFKKGYLEKVLNPPNIDPTKPRTVKVTYKVKGCK